MSINCFFSLIISKTHLTHLDGFSLTNSRMIIVSLHLLSHSRNQNHYYFLMVALVIVPSTSSFLKIFRCYRKNPIHLFHCHQILQQNLCHLIEQFYYNAGCFAGMLIQKNPARHLGTVGHGCLFSKIQFFAGGKKKITYCNS